MPKYTPEQLAAMDPNEAPPPHTMSPEEMQKLAKENEAKRKKERDSIKNDLMGKKQPEDVPNSPQDLGYIKDTKKTKKTDTKKMIKKQVEKQNDRFIGDLNQTARMIIPFADKETIENLSDDSKKPVIITVNTAVVNDIAEEAGKLVMNPKAEAELVKLLQLKELVDSTYERVKDVISKSGEAIMPGFTGVIGEKIKCTYRVYGGKYQIVDPLMAEGFVTSKPKYDVDTKKIDAYAKEHGVLPPGITERERAKTLSISLKEDGEHLSGDRSNGAALPE